MCNTKQIPFNTKKILLNLQTYFVLLTLEILIQTTFLWGSNSVGYATLKPRLLIGSRKYPRQVGEAGAQWITFFSWLLKVLWSVINLEKLNHVGCVVAWGWMSQPLLLHIDVLECRRAILLRPCTSPVSGHNGYRHLINKNRDAPYYNVELISSNRNENICVERKDNQIIAEFNNAVEKNVDFTLNLTVTTLMNNKLVWNLT